MWNTVSYSYQYYSGCTFNKHKLSANRINQIISEFIVSLFPILMRNISFPIGCRVATESITSNEHFPLQFSVIFTHSTSFSFQMHQHRFFYTSDALFPVRITLTDHQLSNHLICSLIEKYPFSVKEWP